MDQEGKAKEVESTKQSPPSPRLHRLHSSAASGSYTSASAQAPRTAIAAEIRERRAKSKERVGVFVRRRAKVKKEREASKGRGKNARARNSEEEVEENIVAAPTKGGKTMSSDPPLLQRLRHYYVAVGSQGDVLVRLRLEEQGERGRRRTKTREPRFQSLIRFAPPSRPQPP